MRVFLLATCRKEELLPFTTFVFPSIRTGFPTSSIYVQGNNLPDYAVESVNKSCQAASCSFQNEEATIDRDWIERLVKHHNDPFAVVDTDVCFYEKVEDWQFATALAGCRIPEWADEFSGAITRSRLHPSLMFIDPVKARDDIAEYESKIPDLFLTPKVNLFAPLVIPFKNRRYFFDTLGFLFHAIGGTAFTDTQLDAYYHMHLGSCSDLVLPRLSNGDRMAEAREAILKNSNLGRGLWRAQMEYCENRQPIFDGRDVINPGTLEESKEATAWRNEICCGDADAVAFCNLAFKLFHSYDDLVDSYEDGRPSMQKDQLANLFLLTATFYNSKFYRAHQELLFALMLDITTTHADSVAFERSPKPHLRAIADVERMCGARFYSMMALICGGTEHRNRIARQIKEREYLIQHDSQGRPI